MLGLMALYVVMGLGLDLSRRRPHRDYGKVIIGRSFNAATFAGSLLLLLGIVFPEVLKAIGSLKPFVLFASFVGLWYSTWALFAK